MRASAVYSNHFLLDDLYRAAVTMNRDEYVGFHANSLNQTAKKLSFDALTVNILHVDENGFPDGEITSAVANVAKSVIGNYEKHITLDEFTPLTFSQTGTALFIEAVKPIDYWLDSPVYKLHCSPYDFHWVIGVSYRYPHQKTTFVAFDYMKAKGVAHAAELTEFDVEYLSYPFYLGWLYQYGAICDQTLLHWLKLLSGTPPARFRVLRGLAEPGIFHAGEFAKNIGSSTKAIYRHLEHAFEELRVRDNDIPEFDCNANRLLALSKAYRFFEFGAASSQSDLPVRHRQTG